MSVGRPSVEALLKEADATLIPNEFGAYPYDSLITDLAAAIRSLLIDAETREGEAFKAGYRAGFDDYDTPRPFHEMLPDALAAYRQQQKGDR